MHGHCNLRRAPSTCVCPEPEHAAQMAKPEPDPTGDFDEHYRDLAALRRLAKEREGLERDSAEWLEYARREEVLTRRIREWAGRPDKAR